MTMTATQGVIWKQIAQMYHQWDGDRHVPMPVSELTAMLPAVPPDLIGETLAQAADDRMAEVDSVGEDPSFRPLQ